MLLIDCESAIFGGVLPYLLRQFRRLHLRLDDLQGDDVSGGLAAIVSFGAVADGEATFSERGTGRIVDAGGLGDDWRRRLGVDGRHGGCRWPRMRAGLRWAMFKTNAGCGESLLPAIPLLCTTLVYLAQQRPSAGALCSNASDLAVVAAVGDMTVHYGFGVASELLSIESRPSIFVDNTVQPSQVWSDLIPTTIFKQSSLAADSTSSVQLQPTPVKDDISEHFGPCVASHGGIAASHSQTPQCSERIINGSQYPDHVSYIQNRLAGHPDSSETHWRT